MIKSCILLLMLAHCSNTNRLDDVFNIDADDIFAQEYGADFYEAQRRLQSIPYKPFNMNDTLMYLRKRNATNLKLNTTTKAPNILTTESLIRDERASISPEIAGLQNISLRYIKYRRWKMQVDRILNSDRSVPNYFANSNVETLTRRFGQLFEENKKQMASKPKTRRIWYSYWYNPEWTIAGHKDPKRRLINLMTHFIYITRYKLVYAQLLRKKYSNSCVYKLGFLFALLRHLKILQRFMLHAVRRNGRKWEADIVGTMSYNYKLSEKTIRLDIDIKNVVSLIEKMEYRANMAYNPNFYEYSLET